MLDPLTAISLASAVVQFVDFSVKLVSSGHELYERGSLANNDELGKITQDLAQISEELGAHRPPSALPPSQDEIALQQLAGSCKEMADEMMAVLQTLKVQKPKSGLEVVRKSLRSMRKKGKIQDIEKRLGKIRDELNLRLTAILSKKQSGVSALLQDLSDETKRHNTIMTDNLQLLQSQLLAILEAQKKSSAKADKLESISSKCVSLVEEGRNVATAQKILKSLHFETIKTRQVNVKDAHAETFEWIFNDPDDLDKPRTNFKDWMRSESKCGIYWVSGKAGSGKSTLMKFLNNHKTTLSTLEEWSEGVKLVIASHFFWNSGNTMQKSQEGLLRSLLFQILRQHPDLIHECCLPRWESPDLYQDHPDPWTIQELSDCFARLAKDPRTPRLFLLVDGLDEYDGEHRNLVQVLQRMNGSPKIKICVSSRPWNVFEDAFGDNTEQKLRLQDFTRDDIMLYTKHQLEADDRFMKLKLQDLRYRQLEQDIVNKAQGVFLWVFLVIRALLRGLTDDNDIAFLQERLDGLPAGLEEYFAKMLSTIEAVYQEQTARIFQVMVHSREPLPAVCLEFLAMEKKDPDYALHEDPPFMTRRDVMAVTSRVRKYVNARCKDLLEALDMPIADSFTGFLGCPVVFLHRSVRDFLATRDIYDLLGSRTGGNFNAQVALCKIVLAELKTCITLSPQFTPELRSVISGQVYHCFYYVQMVHRHRGICEVRLIDELHEVLRLCQRRFGDNFDTVIRAYRYQDNKPIVALAVEAKLLPYVKEKLSLNHKLITKSNDWTLLDHAITLQSLGIGSPGSKYLNTEQTLDVEMVKLLLGHGINPNQKNPNSQRSTWHRFLRQCYEQVEPFFREEKRTMAEIIKLFIQYGADTNIEVAPRRGDRHGPGLRAVSLKEILDKNFTSSQVAEINRVIEEKRRFFVWKWVGWG